MTTTLGKKGQVVIPQEIRRRANLKPGDDFLVSGDHVGRIVLEKVARRGVARAKLLRKKGRLVLAAPPGSPPMTSEQVKAIADGIFE